MSKQSVQCIACSSSAMSHAAFLHHFSKSRDKHVPIAGFKGLYTLIYSIHKFMNLDQDDCDEFEYNRVEFNKTLSSLWLMEQSYSDNKIVYEHDSRIIERVRKALFDIGTMCVWRQDFCERVYFIIQVIRRGGCDRRRRRSHHCYQGQGGYLFDAHLEGIATKPDPMSSMDSTCRIPNEICLLIMEYLVDDLLSHTIWKALKYVSDSAASMNGE